MNREQFDHLIRATGSILNVDSIFVIGSQSILGQFPSPKHKVLTLSGEIDIVPIGGDERLSDLIDGSIGEDSHFHDSFGCYAQGVSFETPIYAPKDWKNRCIPYQSAMTGGVVALCMDVHDLALSKYGAGRDKDLEFNQALVLEGMVKKNTLFERLKLVQCDNSLMKIIKNRINFDISSIHDVNLRYQEPMDKHSDNYGLLP